MCDGMVAFQTRALSSSSSSSTYSLAHRLATSTLLLLFTLLPHGHASGCARPPGVQHGDLLNQTEANRGSFLPGTLLTYGCEPGFTADGPTSIICTSNGDWSHQPPRCIRSNVCPSPTEPENGGYRCHPAPCRRFNEKTVIEYFCDEGYALKGDYKYLTCLNGEWDAPMQISCRLTQGCARPPGVQHGDLLNQTEANRDSFLPGTLLIYGCEPGFTADGQTSIICTSNGDWSHQPPRCIRSNVCSPPTEPENGGYRCHPTPCHRLTQKTVIEYFCDEGYALKGDYKFLTCENGEWDAPMQISCRLTQDKEPSSPLGIPALSIVASTASSVALILLLVVLFVLVQPKLKSFHHSRREQGVSGQSSSIMVEGVQVTLPSYEEAVYGSGEACAASSPPSPPPPPPAPPESRVPIVLSEGLPQGATGGQGPSRTRHHRDLDFCLPSTSSSSSFSSRRHAETVLVHQVPSSSSSTSWAREHPGGACAAPLPLRRDSESSDQHSLLSVTSTDEFSDDIPLLKEA